MLATLTDPLDIEPRPTLRRNYSTDSTVVNLLSLSLL